MADPVAWVMIEPGWAVRDADGKEIGRVHEVTGDENADIFDGLTIKQGILSKDKYVPSEHVARQIERSSDHDCRTMSPGQIERSPDVGRDDEIGRRRERARHRRERLGIGCATSRRPRQHERPREARQLFHRQIRRSNRQRRAMVS